MRRFIFLDIDGVLIPMTEEHAMYRRRTGATNFDSHFDPQCVGVLNAIVRHTHSAIVVHSAWRTHFGTVSRLRRWLKSNGVIGPIAGRTSEWPDTWMQEEIQDWIDGHKVDNYLILDDSKFDNEEKATYSLAPFRDHYLQINPKTGLTKEDVIRAVEYFESELRLLNAKTNVAQPDSGVGAVMRSLPSEECLHPYSKLLIDWRHQTTECGLCGKRFLD